MSLPKIDSGANGVVSKFREFLKTEGYSIPTVKNYLTDLRHFLSWTRQAQPDFDLSNLTDSLLRSHQAHLNEEFRGKPSIAARRISSLRKFLTWAGKEGLVSADLVKSFLGTKEQAPVPTSYREYLKARGFSTPTVKNYLSDLNHLLAWAKKHKPDLRLPLVSVADLASYKSYLEKTYQEKPSILSRRLSSLRNFLSWAAQQGLMAADLPKRFQEAQERIKAPAITPTEAEARIALLPIHKKIIHHARHTRPGWYHRYHKLDFSHTAHQVILVLYVLAVGGFLFFSYFVKPEVEKTKEELGDVLAAATPPRILSFQGRLTDENNVPVTSPTDIVFRIWDQASGGSEVACDGGGDEDCLWKSASRNVTPDQNGIFSVILGDTGAGDPAIPSTLFSENAELYLGVKVGTDNEMTPRQRIAAVSYALNSDALEGFHGSQTPGANQVPILNGSGNLMFAGAAMIGTAGSGALTLDSDSAILTLGTGTNTIVNTDGSTALLINPTGDLQFQSSSNYINSSGNLILAGTLTVGGTSGTIGSGGNTFTFDTSSGPAYAGTARIAKTITLSPEYPGASLSADDGTSNTGSMTSDVDTSNWRNYYQWSSSQVTLQDYSIILKITLPSDFSAWQTSNAIQIRFVTQLTTTADNAIGVRINNEDDTPGTPVVTVSDTASSVAATWNVITIDDSQIDDGGAPDWDAAGERAAIRIKLRSRNSNYARVGDVVLNYLAKF